MYIENNNGGNCILVSEGRKWYTTNCSDTNGFFGDVQIQTEKPISEIAKKKLHKQLEEPGCELYYTNDPEGRFYCDQCG